MKTPKKLYLVVSKTCPWKDQVIQEGDVFVRRTVADEEAKQRNEDSSVPGTDWRVETYVRSPGSAA